MLRLFRLQRTPGAAHCRTGAHDAGVKKGIGDLAEGFHRRTDNQASTTTVWQSTSSACGTPPVCGATRPFSICDILT